MKYGTPLKTAGQELKDKENYNWTDKVMPVQYYLNTDRKVINYAHPDGIRITGTHFVLPHGLYSLEGIKLIRIKHISAKIKSPLITIICGLIFACLGFFTANYLIATIGLTTIVFGLWILQMFDKYALVIFTTAGEINTIENRDIHYVREIAMDLTEAITNLN
ncbi:MAG: DUF6232 family protein [Bacteroidia bacterium]